MQGQVFTLHDDTAFNAPSGSPFSSGFDLGFQNSTGSSTVDDLKGRALTTQAYEVAWFWFVPTSYDGTVFFELSPDGGLSWFPTEGFAVDNRAVKITSIASPPAGGSVYMIILPEIAHIRLRMVGGTTGSLSAYCRLSDYQVAGA